MFKKNIALFVLWSIFVSLCYAAPKKERVDIKGENESLVRAMKERLSDCQAEYSREMFEIQLEIENRVLDAELNYKSRNYERDYARIAVLEKKSNDGYRYKSCITKSKDAISPTIKGYVNTFKKENLKSLAKQLVSQWLVALDSVGEKNQKEESSKFDKAANDMQIELISQ